MKRFVVLACAVAVQVCLGGLLAWSVFVDHLSSTYHLSATQTQSIFGTTIAVFTLSTVLAARLANRIPPALVTAMGGLLLGMGYFSASTSQGEYPALLLSLGALNGCGIGLGYVSPIAAAVAWFPNCRGLAAGVVVAGFGAGAALFTLIVGRLFESGLSCLQVFRVIGIAYGSCVVICGLGLAFPARLPTRTRTGSNVVRYLKDRRFRLLAVGMFSGTFSGLLILGSIRQVGVESGIDSVWASCAIGAFSLGNALGRIAWGRFSDVAHGRSVCISLISISVSTVLLVTLRHVAPTFLVAAGLLGFCFGACFVVYAAQVTESYGAQNLASVYPYVFLAYGLAGVTGPLTGGALRDLTGGYLAQMLLAAGTALTGGMWTIGLISRHECDVSA